MGETDCEKGSIGCERGSWICLLELELSRGTAARACRHGPQLWKINLKNYLRMERRRNPEASWYRGYPRIEFPGTHE